MIRTITLNVWKGSTHVEADGSNPELDAEIQTALHKRNISDNSVISVNIRPSSYRYDNTSQEVIIVYKDNK